METQHKPFSKMQIHFYSRVHQRQKFISQMRQYYQIKGITMLSGTRKIRGTIRISLITVDKLTYLNSKFAVI